MQPAGVISPLFVDNAVDSLELGKSHATPAMAAIN